MQLFASLEQQHGLPAGLLDAVWATESSRGKRMLSPAGAQGHFQFMPATAKQYGLSDPNDLEQSATAAARMYADLLRQTGGDLEQALAGYNWGIGNVQRKGMQQMPAETRNYIQKVNAAMGNTQQPQQQDPWAGLMAEFSTSGAGGKQQEQDPWAELMDQFKQPEPAPQAKAPAPAPSMPAPAPAQQPTAGMQKASFSLRDPDQQQPDSDAFANLRRQVGLTGRYALEGLGQAADIVAAPINALTGGTNPSQSASQLSDWLGLPKPEGKLENIVAGATRLGFGAALPAGVAGKLAPMATSTAGKAVLTGLAENPAAQIGGGVGSGAASSAVKEMGGGDGYQLAAGLAGGVAGGMLGNAAMRSAAKASESAVEAFGGKSIITPKPKQMTPEQLQVAVRQKMELHGQNWDKLPKQAQSAILADVRQANNLDALDAEALRRLTDFRAVGATPTRGTVTLDPVQITREKNLAKAGANSSNGAAHGLAKVENDNNALLIKRLQELQGGRDVDATEAGRKLADNIFAQRDALREAERRAWEVAKASPGYKMPMEAKVLGDLNKALDEEGLISFLDPRISSHIQALQLNPGRFTPQEYRNLMSRLSAAQASGGNEAAAASMAKRILEQAELRPQATQIPNPGNLPATAAQAEVFRATDSLPGKAMSAIDQARAATRAAYAFEDSSPVVRKALSDGSMSDPTRLGKHLLNSTPDEAAEIARLLGNEGKHLARAAIATHIKQKALNGVSDEMGNVSQKALNSAIKSMGEEKLKLFFLDDEIAQLKRLGRVASYMQAQPAGSAVNNSNSGAMVVGKALDALGGLARLPTKIPLFGINQTADAVVNWAGTRGAMNVGKGLLDPQQITGGGILNYSPSSGASRGLVSSGLLATPKEPKEPKERHRTKVAKPGGVKT